ncbi:MAG TPA: DUF5597 domain-containing protein [Candidatus Eisenbergiella intestinipullorum]|nr:DUF5597 domain-containing protein [Candidatus Eisenbergiella intestinipullorum]
MKRHTQFTVQGKPFFSIGGQLHNSTGYALGAAGGEKYEQDVRTAFAALKAIGANTAAVPVCWDAFEPEEGKFDGDYVRRIIDRVREHGMHAVLLWFGTWKNGQMEYTPAWVKADRKRFPRAVCKDGTETAALSPFYEENQQQDQRAFCRLMEILREYDGQTGTVIAVQVENEPGMYAASVRDFSEKGTQAFLGQVPEAVIRTAEECSAAARTGREDGVLDWMDETHAVSGWLRRAWEENGRKRSGSWQEVFGSFGAELCMAWGTARYIDRIAEAGKQIYDIFMYVNVWLDGNGEKGWSLAGLDYPSGGAVSKVLPLWLRAAEHLDAIAPDTYEGDPESVRRTQALYDQEGRAFYVPESGMNSVNASMAVEAAGRHSAVGYHVFGIESGLDEDGNLKKQAEAVRHSFVMLQNAQELLQRYEGSGNVRTLVQHVGQDSCRLSFGDLVCRVSFAGAGPDYAGWVAMDCRHGKDLSGVNRVPASLEEEMARGLLFRAGEREFYLVGHRVRLYWQRLREDGSIPANQLNLQHQAYNMELPVIEEGHFENGTFVVDRKRSGDEARHGIWAQYDCGVVHFVLGE